MKEMTDDELLDKLGHLKRINDEMCRVLTRTRSRFQPEEGSLVQRPFVVDEEAGPVTVALLVTYLGWDLPAFSSAHPGVTTVQDAILDACYASGLAAEEEEEEDVENENANQVTLHTEQDRLTNDLAPEHSIADGDIYESDEVFAAFDERCLVQERERSTLKLVGCGRTDVSVSGTHQVVTLRLKRAKYINDKGHSDTEGAYETELDVNAECDSNDRDIGEGKLHFEDRSNLEDISYAAELNPFLPPEIRVLSWSLVEDKFSARFNCTQRSYTYHFPKGDLDIAAMNDAASRLVGYHDFQNFCKMNKELVRRTALYGRDVRPVSQFFKCVQEAEIVEQKNRSGLTLCELRISANGFLWHQIRCFVSVLLLVGQRLEDPRVVDELFDTESISSKPQYQMASGFPLVLSGSEFFDLPSWHCDSDSLHELRDHFQRVTSDLSAKSAMAASCAADAEAELNKAVKCELLGILKARQRQLANPVGFQMLESIRAGNSTVSKEDVRRKLLSLSRPYEMISGECGGGGGGGEGSSNYQDSIKPFFKMDEPWRKKTRKYTPLLQRQRAVTLDERVKSRKENENLIYG